jgi:quercetin dioxygenase-like cupin family protein
MGTLHSPARSARLIAALAVAGFHSLAAAQTTGSAAMVDDVSGSTAAPGRGVIQELRDGLRTPAVLYDLANMEYRPFRWPDGSLLQGVRRKYAVGAHFKTTWWELKKGAVLSLHSHQLEQVTHLLSGKVSVYSQERRFQLTPGLYLFLLPNVPHELVAEEDSVVEDLQSGDVGNYTGALK